MSDSDIPIDIAVRKLLDWLISRRICSRNWHDGVTPIREKIGEAIGDMPEHEGIKQLLTGSNINYFHCLKIVEFLKETEKDSKNFFGSYGSQRMKDWQQICKMYQGDNIYLAEAASVLSQNVVYEGPGLKKAIAKCDTSEQECDKKEESIKRRINELELEYKKNCQELGISGQGSIKKEIIDLAKGMPELYDRIGEDAKNLLESSKMYQSFVQSSVDGDLAEDVLGNLRFLIENGNVTTYEWKYREKPISVENPEIVFEEDEEDKDNNEDGVIDFGDDQEIDFGDDQEIDFGDENGEIDYGDLEMVEGETSDVIDFGDVDVSAIVVEEGGLAGGVAREEEALSILDNRRTRTIILDELEELAGFLSQRLAEKSSSGAKFSLISSSSQEDCDVETLKARLHNVEKLSGQLTEPRMLQLQLIRSSPEVVTRLVDKLKGFSKMVEKVKRGRIDLENRRVQVGKDRIEATKQLAIVSQRTKDVKLELERDISDRYKGRPVNIMGVVW